MKDFECPDNLDQLLLKEQGDKWGLDLVDTSAVNYHAPKGTWLRVNGSPD